MSQPRRDLNNKPAYYYGLTKKQQNNWKKNAKKINKNEDLREKYPPFHASANIEVIHIHHQSTISTINDLITKAQETKLYVVDTESQKGEREKQGALIQIQFIHSIQQSTIILIETNYLPDPPSNLFTRIKELCGIIFNNNNKIISWGPIEKEFENFDHLNLIHLDLGKIVEIDLQFYFSNEYNNSKTHPEMERRDDQNINYDDDDDDDDDDDEDDDDDDDYPVQVKSNSNQPISLQDVIKTTFGKFIDKSLTVNYWKCGIDLNLKTWKQKLFSRKQYDEQIEKQQRQNMKQYAINDCASVAELYFQIYPHQENDYQIEEKPTTSRIVYINNDDELSDISEDELVEILKPKFNKKQQILNQSTEPKTSSSTSTSTSTKNIINIENNLSDISEDELIEILKPKFEKKQKVLHQPIELITSTTQQEMNEFNLSEEQPKPPKQQLSKAEKQKMKNEKLKCKQEHHPDFQNKITRPIYSRYNYHKIRSQLMDDDIHTSHQITINRHKQEVRIGFKTKEERERATKIIRINYFSQQQFDRRWGR